MQETGYTQTGIGEVILKLTRKDIATAAWLEGQREKGHSIPRGPGQDHLVGTGATAEPAWQELMP